MSDAIKSLLAWLSLLVYLAFAVVVAGLHSRVLAVRDIKEKSGMTIPGSKSCGVLRIFLASLVLLAFALLPKLSVAGNDVWTGSGPLGGRVNALAIDPVEHHVIYAAVENAGVLKSTDSGKTWNASNSGLNCLQPLSLVMDPNDRKTLYVGCFGLYKSTNAGASWNATGLGLSLPTPAIAIHPHDSRIVYASVSGKGIFKSTDAAQTFVSASAGLANLAARAIAIDPVQPNILFASGGTQAGSNIHKSVDGGLSWVDTGGIYVGGAIVVDPQDHRIVYAGSSKSIDQGEHWEIAFNLCSADQRLVESISVAVDPVDHNVLYLAAECSFYRSSNGGGYWTPWYEGLPTSTYPHFTTLALDPADPNTMYLGTANSGVFSITFTKAIPTSLKVISPNGGESWLPGSQQTLRWFYTGELSDVSVELSVDGGSSYSPIATLVMPDANGYLWTVPNTPSSNCRIRVRENRGPNSDFSDASFTIASAPAPPSFQLPVPGSMVAGQVQLELAGIDPGKIHSFLLDGSPAGIAISPSRVWDTTRTTNGLHRITAIGLDQAQTVSIEVAVSVNNPAPLYETLRVLPSSAHAAGLGGAFYTTDLTVSNPGQVAAPFSLQFAGHDISGSQGPKRSFSLAPGQTITFYDVLKSVFGLDSDYGAIRLTSTNSDLTLQGQTSTAGGGGTFGQSVPALGPRNLISAPARLSIAGIREDAFFRTNLVLTNVSLIPVEVRVDFVTDGNRILASKKYSLMPSGMTQITRVVRDLGVSGEVPAGRLDVSTANGAFGVYASVIDNVTNDPRTLLPSQGSQFVPSSAHAPGAGGAFYTTALTLMNRSTLETRVVLQFLGHDVDGRTGPIRRLILPPGGSLIYADVLKSLFGVDSGYGAIRLNSSGFGLLVQTQTSTPGAGGSFGQSVPLPLPGELVKPGSPRHITGVREDASFRTNLILANSSEIAADVDVTLWAGSGDLLGARRVSLPALGMTQLTSVVRALGIGTAVVDARLALSTPTPGAAVAVYASAIDNVTNDPRTLLPLTGLPDR